jgi:hypothetical protein
MGHNACASGASRVSKRLGGLGIECGGPGARAYRNYCSLPLVPRKGLRSRSRWR